MEKGTWKAMLGAREGLVQVAGERISVELEKFFSAARSHHLQLLFELELPPILFDALLPQNKAWLFEALEEEEGGFGFEAVLGIWLEGSDPEEVCDRLRLSRKTKRFLEHWWAGLYWLKSLTGEMTSRDVFRFFNVSDSAFSPLVRAAQLANFPVDLSREERKLLLREAASEGELDWSPLPWSGIEIAQAAGRSPGPWMTEAINRLEEEWATGGCRELAEAVTQLQLGQV
jgi:tRNA nucleotidyltransferase/poly(A) polymerase